MKVTYRIPTNDQYAFIEMVEENVDVSLPAIRIREVYDNLISMFKDGEGISMKEFNTFFDSYVHNGTAPENGMEVWERMSLDQKKIINEFKKCLARIKPKQ